MTDVTVRLDDNLRLLSVVLAATDFPEKSQAAKPHGTHAHARATARFVKEMRSHEAVRGMQSLLDSGAPLEALYTLVAHLPWPTLEIEMLPKWVPANWNKHLADFYGQAKVADWWKNEAAVWDEAVAQSQRAFADATFKPFLERFVGRVEENFVFVPNIGYPSDREIGIRVTTKEKELIAICPSRRAWGDSPPWPFDEDKYHMHSVALMQYSRLILLSYLRKHAEKVVEAAKTDLPISDQLKAQYPTWGDQFVAIFVAAAIAIYLDGIDPKESKAYIQSQVKNNQLTILPGTVNVLQRYLKERDNGKFESFVDFLPVFPKQLKVASKIMSI